LRPYCAPIAPLLRPYCAPIAPLLRPYCAPSPKPRPAGKICPAGVVGEVPHGRACARLRVRTHEVAHRVNRPALRDG
jgi:hypothetical protein